MCDYIWNSTIHLAGQTLNQRTCKCGFYQLIFPEVPLRVPDIEPVLMHIDNHCSMVLLFTKHRIYIGMKFKYKIILICSVFDLILITLILPGSGHSEKKFPAMDGQSIRIGNRYFTATLHDNESNKDRQGSGFNPLTHQLYPGQNLYRDDAVGLNFEHIMNGTAADAHISMFTPRRDTCTISRLTDSSAAVIHKAEHSSWNIDSEMSYRFHGKHYIDLEFKVTLRENKFPLDYIGFMWASYMNCTFDRRIFFMGTDNGQPGWMAFGEDTANGFETGTIGYEGSARLLYEEGSKTLNIIEHPQKKFNRPFYYGLVHGSGRVESQTDTMAYIMMFDQKEPIRFAMWNFTRNSEGTPDTHSPAWDWQYVIREPKINEEYSYRARVVYKSFAGQEDVLKEYKNWVDEIEDQ